jgi:hypothetical protein
VNVSTSFCYGTVQSDCSCSSAVLVSGKNVPALEIDVLSDNVHLFQSKDPVCTYVSYVNLHFLLFQMYRYVHTHKVRCCESISWKKKNSN